MGERLCRRSGSSSLRQPTQTPWGYGYGYQWWTLPDAEAYAATRHYEQKIYVVPRADLVIVFTADIADQDPHPADSFLERHIIPACTDLPEVSPVETCAKYGFAFDYPLGAQLLEAPFPGSDAISDAAGMVQFNTLYPPLEVVNLVWYYSEDGPALRQHLEEFRTSIDQQTGTDYEWGDSTQSSKDHHELLLQFFHTTANGLPLAGVTGIWHCGVRPDLSAHNGGHPRDARRRRAGGIPAESGLPHLSRDGLRTHEGYQITY